MNTNTIKIDMENREKSEQRIAREAAEYAYNNSRWTYSDIWDAYANPSAEKVRAWKACESLCDELGGHGLMVSSRNTFNFSVVFTFEQDGREIYAYITRDHERFGYAEEA